MNTFKSSHQCTNCSTPIDSHVMEYSLSNFRHALCIQCQNWYKEIEHSSSSEAIDLYFSLKKRNVPAELEKFDGHKTIDIAIPYKKINIEVDGAQHNFNSQQALADLKRTYYSFIKGFFTIRIPNSLVKHNLEETAELITDILNGM